MHAERRGRHGGTQPEGAMAPGQRVGGWSGSCGTRGPLNFEGVGATPAHKGASGGTDPLSPPRPSGRRGCPTSAHGAHESDMKPRGARDGLGGPARAAGPDLPVQDPGPPGPRAVAGEPRGLVPDPCAFRGLHSPLHTEPPRVIRQVRKAARAPFRARPAPSAPRRAPRPTPAGGSAHEASSADSVRRGLAPPVAVAALGGRVEGKNATHEVYRDEVLTH